ncbi:MAG TPA: DUF4911 domain-containing protein [Candidatus Avidehalobacter gallistercoris]|uniref:DUF4911 domain-containing protein n=1 Tax=Candidatus Avidehalobacter gallistercoris TaxID=2840694 RepID=A0A9D1HIS2_9FIRM|nr:DUF4911 domain-containing protein [Candidatus Avidehalobacter gallistercoris]
MNVNNNDRAIAVTLLERYPEEAVRVTVPPEKIDYFNKIIEAYDNLAIVSTVDAPAGEVVCWVTPDMRSTLIKLLEKLRFPKIMV